MDIQSELYKLTDIQLRWLQARLRSKTDKDACEIIGIASSTCYNWEEKPLLNKLLQDMRLQDIEITRERLGRLGGKAIDVIEEELDDSEKNRAYIVFNLLDRIGISAKQQIDVTSGGQPITLTAEERELRLKALLNKDA